MIRVIRLRTRRIPHSKPKDRHTDIARARACVCCCCVCVVSPHNSSWPVIRFSFKTVYELTKMLRKMASLAYRHGVVERFSLKTVYELTKSVRKLASLAYRYRTIEMAS